MKKILKLSVIILLIGTAMLINSSCVEKVKGCMDKNSLNYNASAEVDDGSCTYQGSVVFYYGQSVAQTLINDGITALTFYVNGQVVGSSAANIYWASAPACGSNGSITCTIQLGTNKTQSYNYAVKDQAGNTNWSGVVNVNGNGCTTILLTAKKK